MKVRLIVRKLIVTDLIYNYYFYNKRIYDKTKSFDKFRDFVKMILLV